ncbi:zf-HC2 domain-containing protein, partial [Eubacterium ramulus]
CDVIQDLMPVYIEHMCSTESRKLVEAHMAECEGCRHVFRAYTDETIVREVSRTEAHAEGKENEFHQILKNVENKVIKRVAVIAVIIVSFAAAIGIINFVPVFPASYEDAIVHVTASEEKDRIDIDTAQVRLHEDVVDDSIVLTGRYSLAARRSYEKSGQRYRYEKSLENRKISRVIYRGTDGTETVLWEK